MPNPVIKADLVRLAAEAKAAQVLLEQALRASFPPDAPVSWAWHDDGPLRHGHVVRWGFGDRLEVRNSETGADYWIRTWRVLEALPR